MRHAVALEPLAEVARPFGRREAENRDGTHWRIGGARRYNASF
jgi:hypothetical protein